MWQCNRSTLNSVAQQSVSSCSLYSLRFSFLNIIMFFFLHFAVVRQWQWGWGWTGKQEERRENMQQTATGRPNPGHCSLAVQHVVTCKPTELKLFSVFFFSSSPKCLHWAVRRKHHLQVRGDLPWTYAHLVYRSFFLHWAKTPCPAERTTLQHQ